LPCLDPFATVVELGIKSLSQRSQRRLRSRAEITFTLLSYSTQ
jgi:hypothetical protein